MRELAARDFAKLERDGYVIRDDLRPEAAKAWRHAIAGVAHAKHVRLDSGELAGGKVWASLNTADPPPDLRRNGW